MGNGKELKEWCVYIHTFPNNKAYIGIAHGDPKKRWKYGYGYKQEYQPAMYYAIKKYGWNNIQHYIFAEQLTEKEAKHMEQLLIALYKTNCCRYNRPSYGYNMTDGGEGCYGVVRSEETRKKLSRNAKERFSIPENNPMFGKKHTEESKRAMSEKRKGTHIGEDNHFFGKHHSEETRKKLRENHKGLFDGEKNPNYGNHWSQEIKDQIRDNNPNTKIVLQFDSNENLLQEYASIRQVVRETGLRRQSVSRCCNYKDTSCGGYFWMFKSEYEKYGKLIYKQDNRLSEEVIQCDDSGNIIATYSGPTEAHRTTGIGLHAISKCLNKKSKHSGGYRWFYPKDYKEFIAQ